MHSETGYEAKPINVARAVLYTLAPPGMVLILPDSLWHGPLWASMLAGSCLRGARALIIHPSQRNAPGQAFMTLSRANEMFERAIIFRHEMEDQIEAVGGQYRVGLYDTDIDVANIPARLQAAADGLRVPWLREALQIPDDWEPIFANADSIFPDFQVEYIVEDVEDRRPKLHLKTNLFVSASVLRALLAAPEWGPFVLRYAEERVRDVISEETVEGYRSATELGRALRPEFVALVESVNRSLAEDEEDRVALYNMVGSTNMDYRSMLMDGEVALLISGKGSMAGFLDAVILAGAARWIDDVDELDQYLPRYEGFKWKTSRWIKNML
jgi:hypothetical protein